MFKAPPDRKTGIRSFFKAPKQHLFTIKERRF
nr:MAG TPA: hypothetical protein [Caudoviricetes sp.]